MFTGAYKNDNFDSTCTCKAMTLQVPRNYLNDSHWMMSLLTRRRCNAMRAFIYTNDDDYDCQKIDMNLYYSESESKLESDIA